MDVRDGVTFVALPAGARPRVRQPGRRRLLMSSFVAIAVFVALQLDADGWWAGGFFLACVVTVPTLLVVAAARRSRALAALAILPMVATAVGLPVTWIVERWQIAVTQERGDRVAAALEAFRARTNEYPRSLEELEAHELDPVPRTAMGCFRPRPFEYERNADGFWLVFELSGWTWCRRGPSSGWREFD